MIKDILAAFLGLLQGSVIFPLTIYLGLLVWRDLSQRHTKFGTITNIIAPLAMMVTWIVMSYLAADSLLDIIACSPEGRLKAGRLWVVCSFLGLVALAVTFVALSKIKLLRR